jgi:hypothetical protein
MEQRDAEELASKRIKREAHELQRMLRGIEHCNAHRGDALTRIRHLLDAATGQTPQVAKGILREIATIDRQGAAPPGWRALVMRDYPNLDPLLDWIFRHDVDGNPLKQAQDDRNSGLTDEQRKLVTDHLPLVRKLAVRRASTINNLAGGTVLDDVVLDQLESIGLKVLEVHVRRWDSARGVTFGAFVQLRVAGAMNNFLSRERIKTADSRAEAREKWKSKANGARAESNRTSTGGKKVRSYAETPARHPDRLIRANPADPAMSEALAQLTPKQRTVYEGRMLADPQVSLGTLAAQLKVTRAAIVALEKRARLRIENFKRGI